MYADRSVSDLMSADSCVPQCACIDFGVPLVFDNSKAVDLIGAFVDLRKP